MTNASTLTAEPRSPDQEKLFVAVDPRDAIHVALQRAIITSLLRDRLPKLHVYISIDAEAGAGHRENLLFDQQWIDANIHRPLADSRLPYEIEMAWSPRWLETILQSSARFAADMIMMPVHGDATAPFTLTRRKWELLQYAPCPTLLVREQTKPLRHVILAAVNAQAAKPEQKALNRRILEKSAQIALRYDAGFYVVNAYRDSLHYPDHGLLTRLSGLPSNRIYVRHGYTDKVVPEVAEELGADIVVAGMLNQRGSTSTVRGTTTARLIEALEVDTLIVN